MWRLFTIRFWLFRINPVCIYAFRYKSYSNNNNSNKWWKRSWQKSITIWRFSFPNFRSCKIYAGNNYIIHARQPGQSVRIEKLWSFCQIRRFLFDEVQIKQQKKQKNAIDRVNKNQLDYLPNRFVIVGK